MLSRASSAITRLDRLTVAHRLACVNVAPASAVDWSSPLSGMLTKGAVHEWFTASSGEARKTWLPALGILVHAAREGRHAGAAHGRRLVVWIGRRCWPYPRVLISPDGSDRSLLENSIFVDATSRDERVWATDLALRCPASAAVIAVGSGLTMAESRRLQLAAAAAGAIGLIARPGSELRELSAARTRWLVHPAVSSTQEPRWSVELLRCKGARLSEEARRWVAWWDREKGVINLAADVPGRSAETTGSATRRTG